MGNSVAAREVFEKLDTDGSGVLTLDKILSVKELPGVKNVSLCAINVEEFSALVKYVQSVERKVQKKMKKAPNFFQDFLARKIRRDHDVSHDKRTASRTSNGGMRSPHVSTTNVAQLSVDRTSSTPMITSYHRQGPENSSDESHDSGSDSGNDTDEEEERTEAGNFVKRFLDDLSNLLKGRDGRERYMTWLFKLAARSREKNGLCSGQRQVVREAISVEELEIFLQAVSRDGINLEEVLYDQGEPTKLAQRVMDEYNIHHTGLLSREEFMVLADLIAKEYELCQARDLECIGKYQLTRTLGKGSYGVVRCAINKDSGERKAMKIIKRGGVSDMSRLDVEIRAMMMLRHPNVVRLEEVLETEDNVCLVMELCGGGSLYEQSMLTPDHPFDEELGRFYFAQIADGLQYCHECGVVHRDLRLENLLLDNQGHLKITDFGHAGIFKAGWDIFSTSLVGSLYHLSPEQISGKCYSGEKMDIWSAGVLLYCVLQGQPPFFTENVVELLENIKAGKYTFVKPISDDAKDLIDRMLQVDPKKRITTSEIKKHQWMRGPMKEPVLVRVELPLDPLLLNDPEKSKRIIADAVRERDIHVHDTHRSPRSPWAMHCYCPADNLKFSVALMRPDTNDPHPYIEFRLKDGESLLFRKLCRRFQALCQRPLQEVVDRLHREQQQLPRSPSTPTSLDYRTPAPTGEAQVEAKPSDGSEEWSAGVGMGMRSCSAMSLPEQAPVASAMPLAAREIMKPREPQSPKRTSLERRRSRDHTKGPALAVAAKTASGSWNAGPQPPPAPSTDHPVAESSMLSKTPSASPREPPPAPSAPASNATTCAPLVASQAAVPPTPAAEPHQDAVETRPSEAPVPGVVRSASQRRSTGPADAPSR